MKIAVLTLGTPDRLRRIAAQHCALRAAVEHARAHEAPTAELEVVHFAALLCPAPEFSAAAGRLPASIRTLGVATAGDIPLARARNTLAQAGAAAGAELLLFLDADCLPAPRLLDRYVRVAHRHPGGLLTGPVTYLSAAETARGLTLDSAATDAVSLDCTELGDMTRIRHPHPARPDPPDGTCVTVRAAEASARDYELFWSLSFALAPASFTRIGGFCTDYGGYGGEDTDFGRCALHSGVDLVWVGGADAVHAHHPVSSPPVEHAADIVANAKVFFRRWGEWPMRGWLEAFAAAGIVEFRPAAAGPDAGLRLL